jgi:hypothetical protein
LFALLAVWGILLAFRVGHKGAKKMFVQAISQRSNAVFGKVLGMVPVVLLVGYVACRVWSMLPSEIKERF